MHGNNRVRTTYVEQNNGHLKEPRLVWSQLCRQQVQPNGREKRQIESIEHSAWWQKKRHQQYSEPKQVEGKAQAHNG
jgi:hypothetical protein